MASAVRASVLSLAVAVGGCAKLLSIDDVAYGGADAQAAGEAASGVEDCENGLDDDGDGLVDCADPDCLHAGYECVALAQPWASPAMVVVTDAGAPPPCVAPFPREVLTGGRDPTSATASCGCTCGPGDAGCGSGELAAFDVACATSCGTPIVAPLQQCVNTTPSWTVGCGAQAYYRPIFPVTSAPCEPRPTIDVPPPFGATVRVCTTESTRGCPTSGVCVRKTPAAGSCLAVGDDVPCPPTHPTRTTVFDSKSTDSRGCTACTCGARAGAKCDGQIAIFSTPGCDAGGSGSLGSASCAPPSVTVASLKLTAPPTLVETGACPPAAVEATGRLDLLVKGTVCCAR